MASIVTSMRAPGSPIAVVAASGGVEYFETSAGSAPPAALPIAAFVDPQNSTGFASDTNTGQNATNVPPGTGPILTTAEENVRIAAAAATGLALSADFDLQYLSEDTSGTPLVPFVGIDIGSFQVNIRMTPVVVHTGGVLDVGTITMNATLAGGGQEQTTHASDLANWLAFQFTALPGGLAAIPTRVIDTVTTAGSWIMWDIGAGQASVAAPTLPAGTPGALTIGNAYTVTRPGQLDVAAGVVIGTSGNVNFFDCAFASDMVGPTVDEGTPTGGGFTASRCAFLGSIRAPCLLTDCYAGGLANGAFNGTFSPFLTAGAWLAGNDFLNGLVELEQDTYVTAFGIFLGNEFVDSVSPVGRFQLQRCFNPRACIDCFVGGTIGTIFAAGLIWGKNNVGVPIYMHENANIQVPAAPNVPNLVGAAFPGFDFVFFAPGVLAATQSRAWDETVGAYTSLRNNTFALLQTPIAGGGFGGNAHRVDANGSLLLGG